MRGGICTNILHKSPVGTILVQILAAHNRWKTEREIFRKVLEGWRMSWLCGEETVVRGIIYE